MQAGKRIRLCRECGQPFTRVKSQKYCGPICRETVNLRLQKLWREKKRESDPDYDRRRWQKFSKSERGQEIIKKRDSIKRVRPRRRATPSVCIQCGSSFFPFHRTQKFCSHKCYGISRFVTPEHRAQKSREWNVKNRERILQRGAEYRQRIRDGRIPNPAVGWKERMKTDWGYRLGRMASRAGGRAIKAGVPFEPRLKEVLRANPPTSCTCCGIKLDINGGLHPDSPTLDRLIPHLGYTVDNTRVVCARCNFVKCNASVEELERIAAYIYRETSVQREIDSAKEVNDELRIM